MVSLVWPCSYRCPANTHPPDIGGAAGWTGQDILWAWGDVVHNFCAKIDAPLVYTSAKTGVGISEAFEKLLTTCSERYDDEYDEKQDV